MGARMRALDWSKSPLGPVDAWPQSLRSTVSMLLPSKAQIIVFWGPEFVVLVQRRVPSRLRRETSRTRSGFPVPEAWSEIWESQLHALLAGVVRTGEAFWAKDLLFEIERHGFPEETYFDVLVRPGARGVGRGRRCVLHRHRNDRARRRRAAAGVVEEPRRAQCHRAHDHGTPACWPPRRSPLKPQDVLFALTYLGDELQSCTPGAREQLARVEARNWSRSCHCLRRVPTAQAGRLVVGLNPRRPFDDQYRAFLDLVADQLGTALANARAYEEERQRAEALAALDRAKTTFFSNVSHEFRTPADAARRAARRRPGRCGHAAAARASGTAGGRASQCPATAASRQYAAGFLPHRGGPHRRQLRTDRPRAVDGGASRACSDRRSRRRASQLVVDCDPLPEPVYVDREMWEKIRPESAVERPQVHVRGPDHRRTARATAIASSCVSPTPASAFPRPDLPRMFERFHRVKHSRARTHEGTGIGLALVQELARLHGGGVTVASEEGRGTTFTVTIRPGTSHLPTERIAARAAAVDERRRASRTSKKRFAGCPPMHRSRSGTGADRDLMPTTTRPTELRVSWSPTTTPTCGTICAACSDTTIGSTSSATAQPRSNGFATKLPISSSPTS